MNTISLVFLGLMFLFLFLSIGIMAVWVYKDAKERGLNGILWVAIAIFVPNFMGILLYFLVGRKEEKTVCSSCKGEIPRNSKYCENCGTLIEGSEKVLYRHTIKGKKYMMGVIISLLLMIGSFTGLIISSCTYEDIHIQSGYSLGCVETSFLNKWNVKYKKSTNNFYKTIKIKENEPNTLYIDAECEEGESYLTITQKEEKEVINLSNLEDTLQYDLAKFNKGKITLCLSNKDGKNISTKIHWD